MINRLIQSLLGWLRSPRPISYIRTYVPMGVGLGLAWLSSKAGFVIDEETSTALMLGAAGVVQALYYLIVRRVEEYAPKAGRLLGRAVQPVYPGTKGFME